MRREDILRSREGNLGDTPLPVLLVAILRDARTCTLELRLRQLEKRIVFEDGSPVACSSNLLHETLGKFLVEKGRLTEAQYQAALAESISTGVQMGELLVLRQLLSPFDLYKQLQANLAMRILEAFRWSDAKWRLGGDAEASTSALRMNPAQLILTGTSSFLPFDTVATHLTFSDDERFAAPHTPPAWTEGLKLSGKDARFLNVLRGRPTFDELMAQSGLEVEPALRKLYAFTLLGLADFARQVPEQPPAAPSPPPSAPAPAAPPAQAFADEDPGTRDALVAAFLEHRSRDPFSLLGVPEDASPGALRQAFLDLAARFAPVRFRTPELREKAEALLVAYARAFAVLVDPEQLALWRERRRALEAKKKGQAGQSAREAFRIRTDLLDARTQFDEARRRLGQNDPRGALEYFEYACDIEPRPLYRAWRAWSRYLLDPARHGRLAVEELSAVCREEDPGDEPFGFLGEVHRGMGDLPEAEAAFRRAFKLNPARRDYAEAIARLTRGQTRT
jgi:hypothetical protein